MLRLYRLSHFKTSCGVGREGGREGEKEGGREGAERERGRGEQRERGEEGEGGGEN